MSNCRTDILTSGTSRHTIKMIFPSTGQSRRNSRWVFNNSLNAESNVISVFEFLIKLRVDDDFGYVYDKMSHAMRKPVYAICEQHL